MHEHDNGAFINDFIDICWVDPWSDNPSIPKKRKRKKAAAVKPSTLKF
jgi:hypothetical protein